jgi:ketose-bisphosphate aldolase
MDNKTIMQTARNNKTVIPAFNIPYLPMLEPVVEAIRDEKSFGFIAVARLEWVKFESGSMKAVRDEFTAHRDDAHVRLHLDHIPVIDEDGLLVPYEAELEEAASLGYQSLMVDGSRLSLEENIAATVKASSIAHGKGLPLEAELGAVTGHESGPTPPYEELFASKKGFTKTDEARRFARESGCDWLSVAIGNIHGAIAEGFRDKKKPAARLDLDHLAELSEATGLPLVLHGGSGIPEDYVRRAIERGIAKINIGTEIRQAYEVGSDRGKNPDNGRRAVYEETRSIIRDRLQVSGSSDLFR